MAYDESVVSISLDAAASIGEYTGVPNLPGSAKPNYGKQYRFVKIVGPHQAGLAATGDAPVGVLQNKPQEPGAAATVAISGVVNVMAGAAGVGAGALVGPDADGKAVAGGTSGVAVSTAQAGSLVSVLLTI